MSVGLDEPRCAADADGAGGFVEIRNVTKAYGSSPPVVEDLSLSVKKGEFLTLLGPSGSGKTTTLMMLAGFEAPSSGEVLIDGSVVNDVAPYKRNIGVVFQSYALFPHMTVEQNVAFPLQARRMGKSEIKERVGMALDMVQLSRFGERRPGQLSGGQQQRVALARALVFGPNLVLLDEPLGALDKQLRQQIQFEIRTIHARLGVTMIYVTHDQSEALTMSDRIAVFSNGRIQQISGPRELYESPRTPFVAQFIGDNNLLEGGVVTEIGAGTCTVALANCTVRGVPVNVGGTGSEVVISIRPEAVLIEPEGGSVDNMTSAKVEELIYLGDQIQVRLAALGVSGLMAKLPASALIPGLAQGASVRIGWRSHNCLVFEAGATR